MTDDDNNKAKQLRDSDKVVKAFAEKFIEASGFEWEKDRFKGNTRYSFPDDYRIEDGGIGDHLIDFLLCSGGTTMKIEYNVAVAPPKGELDTPILSPLTLIVKQAAENMGFAFEKHSWDTGEPGPKGYQMTKQMPVEGEGYIGAAKAISAIDTMIAMYLNRNVYLKAK